MNFVGSDSKVSVASVSSSTVSWMFGVDKLYSLIFLSSNKRPIS